jgi:hypothetical protein
MTMVTVTNEHDRRKYWIAVRSTEFDIASESIGIMAHFTIKVRHQAMIYQRRPLPYLSRPALIIDIDDTDEELGADRAGAFVADLVRGYRIEELHDLRAGLIYSRYGFTSHRYDLARPEFMLRKAPNMWLKRNPPSTIGATPRRAAAAANHL